MKKLFASIALAVASVSGAASAADMPVAGPVYKVQTYAPYSWTGFYIGIHAGADWSSTDWHAPGTPNNAALCLACPTSSGSHDTSSWLAGGQLGYNYQIAWFVGGVEAQISATSLQGSHTVPSFPAITLHSKTDTVGTLAGRAGIAFDQALFFVKGGAAFAHDKYWSSVTGGADLSSATDTRWGWMFGVGFEWAFFQNWSVKFEYDHMDFHKRRETLSPVGPGAFPFDHDISETVDLVKVGLNYRFGYSPVVAKY
jgi:outer membrane immunogenic protein